MTRTKHDPLAFCLVHPGAVVPLSGLSGTCLLALQTLSHAESGNGKIVSLVNRTYLKV